MLPRQNGWMNIHMCESEMVSQRKHFGSVHHSGEATEIQNLGVERQQQTTTITFILFHLSLLR